MVLSSAGRSLGISASLQSHPALTARRLRRAYRELAQRRERAAKLARLAADMASAKAAQGKGTKRKVPPAEAGGAPQFKFKTERKK